MNGIPRATRRAIVIACSVVLIACGSAAYFWQSLSRQAIVEPFFPGLGSYHRTVTTRSQVAQKYFDQGLAFLYGFDQDAALASFQAAAASDPDCGMAYWGIAMAEGAKVDDPEAVAPRTMEAYKASREAMRLARDASPVEQALIKAAAQRFDVSQGAESDARDQSYASAMRRAWQAFPDDPDVGALTAKAIAAAHSLDVSRRSGTGAPAVAGSRARAGDGACPPSGPPLRDALVDSRARRDRAI